MGHRFEELKHRVEAKKKEYQAKLETYKADKHADAAENTTKVKTKLNEIEEHIKTGWDNISDATAEKINNWLK